MARKKQPRYDRRKRGTGSIRHKPGRAQPWEAEWRHDDATREYRGFSSRSEAAAWLDELAAKRERGQDTTAGAQSFSTFIQKWLLIKQTKGVAAKTMHTYQFYAETASGQIGKLRIDCLTLEHMEALLAYLIGAKFQNTHALFGMLGQAFKYARASSLRWMTVDPLDGLEIPPVQRRKNQILTVAQRAHLLELAREEHDPDVPLLPLWHLYSRLGLRKGEGIALMWVDVDWENKILRVDESITNVGADNPRGSTKNRQIRLVPLPDDILTMLADLRRWQQRRGVFGAIFVDAQGETVTPQHVQYRWVLLRKRAGFAKTTIHDLRHTALTILALAGVPENVRMALAGHRSTQMADLYSNHASVEDIRRFVG